MDTAALALIIALVGNGVAILVVVLSNISASRREERRLDREDARLQLQRLDVRVQQAREDRWRVIEFQRDYYVDYYLQLRSVSLVVHNARYEDSPLESNWQLPAYEKLLRLRVFATEFTYAKALEAYNALYKWGSLSGVDFESDEEQEYDRSLREYLIAARHDLGIILDENRLSADDIIR